MTFPRSRSTAPAAVALAIGVLALAAFPAAAQMQSSPAYTTTDDLRDVRPFQAWFQDATFTPGVDVEPVLEIGNWDNATTIFLGAQGAVWVNDGVEVGGRLGYLDFDYDGGGGDSGISDLGGYVRYRLPIDAEPVFALGAALDLPIGDENLGQGSFDFQVFGAMRYAVQEGVSVLAHFGVSSLERGDDRESGVTVGGGALVPMTEELALVAEIDLDTAAEYAAVTGGVDYELPPGGHLRAALALGLDDAAPDLELRFGFSIPVY